MAARKRPVTVTIRWELDRDKQPRKDETGRGYAILRWSISGKRGSQTIGYVSESEAEQLRVETESRLRLGMTPSAPSSGSATVRVVCALYVRDLAERSATPRAIETTADRLACVTRWLGNIAADRLDAEDLRRYVADRRTDEGELVEVERDGHVERHRVGGGKTEPTPRKSTVQNEIRMLRHAYKIARKRGVIDCDPPEYPSFKGWPDDDRPHRELTEPEAAAVVAECYRSRAGESFGRMIEFLAWCPRRPIAVWALRRRDCARVLDASLTRDEQLVFFSRDKAGIGRGWGPITEAAREVLVAQLEATTGEPDDLVWRSRGGRAWYPALIHEPFKAACERANVADVQIYDLRKFACSRVYDAHPNVYVVQKYSGHRDIRALIERYLSASKVEAAALAGSIGWRDELDQAAGNVLEFDPRRR